MLKFVNKKLNYKVEKKAIKNFNINIFIDNIAHL